MPLIFLASLLTSLVFALLPSAAGGQGGFLMHLLAFGVIGLTGAVAFPRVGKGRLFLGILAFGCMIELLQMASPLGRSPDLSDVAVDAAAAFVAIVLVRAFQACIAAIADT